MVHPFVKFVTGITACYAGTALYIGIRQEKRVTAAGYYHRAVEIINADRYLKERLGKPIQTQLRVGHRSTIDEDLNAYFLIDMTGTKNKGVAFITANKANLEEDWVLQKVQVANPRNLEDKLVIFEREPSPNSPSNSKL